MNVELTELVFILDRSGSMGGLESDTISGFNGMIERQKKEGEKVNVTTILFDGEVEIIHDRFPIDAVQPLTDKISSIEDNQETVNALMKKLKNPPDEYKDAYDAVSDLYDSYISLTNCATDPSGSLQTYSSTFSDADTNTLNAYKAMELYLDD